MLDKVEQIRQAHAPFIHAMVKAAQNAEERQAFMPQINVLKQQGWNQLATACERILGGKSGETVLAGLDEEDNVIVSAILAGIQNPQTLPDLNAEPHASDAAPALASIIHAAASGDTSALHALSMMAEQMSQAGGPMAEIAGILRRLVNGERDANQLAEKLSPGSEQLLIGILAELGKLEPH